LRQIIRADVDGCGFVIAFDVDAIVGGILGEADDSELSPAGWELFFFFAMIQDSQ
jgi:hypothetical protein